MILLRGGDVFDGSGAPGVRADVLVVGDRILEVGQVEAPDAQVIDCTGRAVAPGFIDLHSHSDLQALDGSRAKVSQGVTTEVVGNCGFSPYPYLEDKAALRSYANGILYGSGDWGWASAREYLEEARRRLETTNVVSLIGHGSLRVAVMGTRQDAPTAAEQDRMEGLLDDALSAGAAGFSTGLMYAPGSSAPREELEGLLRVVTRRGKIHTTHMRSYSWDLIESVDEQISLARAAGCRLQISHFQSVGRKNWSKQSTALERLDQARSGGIDVEFDSYPYLAGSTVATQLVPQSALDGGVPALLALLADPGQRAELNRAANAQLAQQWSDVHVASVGSEANQRLVGMTFAAVGGERGVDGAEALFQLLEEEKGDVNILSFNQSEENLRILLAHPLCSVISDGFYVKGRPHPRLYGTFPELLGTVVREKQWLGLAEAIHKVTEKPARRAGISGRGLVRQGMMADLTVFSPDRIRSNSTYEDPQNTPDGIAIVIRGGKLLH